MSAAGSSGGSTAFSFPAEDESQATRQSAQSRRLSSSDGGETGSSLFALPPCKRKGNNLSELTVDKLRFDALGLHGRDDEISILQQEFQSLVQEEASSSNQCRLCLISGQSGTGKTKLAETLTA